MPIRDIRVFHWDTSAMLVFGGAESPMHEHVAQQFALGVDSDARVQVQGGRWHVAPALLVPQGMPHGYDATSGVHVVLWIEPESLVGRAIRERYAQDSIHELSAAEVDPVRRDVLLALRDGLGPEGATRIRRSFVELLTRGVALKTPAADPRLRQAIKLMRERQAEDLSVADLASLLAMSESSLSHLFREQIGVPVSRYRMWIRALEAMRLMSGTATVTEAAHGAGFADSAHLSRTFKKLFGQSPATAVKGLVKMYAIDSDYGVSPDSVPST